MAKSAHSGGVVVIGLGRFGMSLALELMNGGTEVLGVDADRKVVQSLAGRLTHVVEADSTDEDAMRQLSVHEFDRAVIGVGTDLEASILSASVVLNLRCRTSGQRRSAMPTLVSSPRSACTTSYAPNTTWASGSRTSCAAG